MSQRARTTAAADGSVTACPRRRDPAHHARSSGSAKLAEPPMIDTLVERCSPTPPPTTRCAPSTSAAPATTSARARTGWPPTPAANGHAPATWSAASPTPRNRRHRARRTPSTLPVVCTVRGWAVGLGCNLALAADFTVADRRRRVLGTVRRPRLQPGLRLDVAAAPARRGGAGQADAAARREGERRRRRRLGPDPSRRRARRARRTPPRSCWPGWPPAPTVAIGLAKQAMHYGQHATLAQAMNQELFNLELVLPHNGFQGGPGRVPGPPHARLQGR